MDATTPEGKADTVYRSLEAEIMDGRRPPGSLLPTVKHLRESWGVSTTTVGLVFDRLETHGLIDRQKGARAVVRPPWRLTDRDAIGSYVAGRRQPGKAGGVAERHGLDLAAVKITCESSLVPASPELATVFGSRVGGMAGQRVWTWERAIDGDRLQMTTSWIHPEVIAAHPELLDDSEPAPPGGLTEQLRAAGWEAHTITDYITARPPMSWEVEHLGLPAGVAVLCIRKVAEDAAGFVFEVTDSVHGGNTTRLVYRIPLADLAEG